MELIWALDKTHFIYRAYPGYPVWTHYWVSSKQPTIRSLIVQHILRKKPPNDERFIDYCQYYRRLHKSNCLMVWLVMKEIPISLESPGCKTFQKPTRKMKRYLLNTYRIRKICGLILIVQQIDGVVKRK